MPSLDWAEEDRLTLQPVQRPTLLSTLLLLSEHSFPGNYYNSYLSKFT